MSMYVIDIDLSANVQINSLMEGFELLQKIEVNIQFHPSNSRWQTYGHISQLLKQSNNELRKKGD